MQTQVTIIVDELGKPWVSGRTLHPLLMEKGGNFGSWAIHRVKSMVKGKDYRITKDYQNPDYQLGSSLHKILNNYVFSINAAKRLALLENKTTVVEELENYESELKSTPTTVSDTNLPVDKQSPTRPPLKSNFRPISEVENSTPTIFDEPSTSSDQMLGEAIKPLIQVTRHERIGLSVSGRALFYLIAKDTDLTPRDRYADWFGLRQKKFALIDGKDFIRKGQGYFDVRINQFRIEHILSIGIAKSIAGFEQQNRGVEVLEYLAKYEEPVDSNAFVGEVKSLELTTNAQVGINHSDIRPIMDGNIQEIIKPIPPTPSDAAARILVSNPPVQESKAAVQGSAHKTAFQELLHRIEESAKVEQTVIAHEAMFDDHQTRLVAVETKVDALVNFFRQAALVLFGELPVGPPPAEVATVTTADQVEEHFALEPQMLSEAPTEAHVPLTPRAAIVQHVRDFAAHTKIDHEELWRHLYKRLFETTGFNVSKHKTQADKSYMNVVVRHNQLENLISIVTAELLPKMGVSVG